MTTHEKKIIIASSNRGKIREIKSILETEFAPGINFVMPSDQGIPGEPEETGVDYQENAILKARFYGELSKMITLADDSGLEVAALDGFPGIKSARLKAPVNTDKSRYETLLELMLNLNEEERGARFVCVAAAYLPDKKQVITARGEWQGRILTQPSGEGGFGYDPIFYDPVLNKTAAEMSAEQKNLVSHRAKAFKALWAKIRNIVLDEK